MKSLQHSTMNRLALLVVARCALAFSNDADANSAYEETTSNSYEDQPPMPAQVQMPDLLLRQPSDPTSLVASSEEAGLTPDPFAPQEESSAPDPVLAQEQPLAIQPLSRESAVVDDAAATQLPGAMQPVASQAMKSADWAQAAASTLPKAAQSPKSLQLKTGMSLSSVSAHREDGNLLVQGAARHAEKDIGIRPGALAGKPDVVAFGIFAKSFFGADLKHNKFVLDNIMALKWTDPRVVALVPAGMDSFTMSQKQAMAKIWMPEIVITNRDIRKLEVISTVVTIFKTGEVTKIERAVVVCNNIYLLEQYPFDTQSMKLKIASSKYMLNELVLKPSSDKTLSGVNPGIFDAFQYNLDKWKVYSFDEKDGAMQKSRGVLDIRAERTLDKYSEAHLMPAFLLLVISWGVFWFPFQQPFITPRLALSILALLSFTTLMIKSGNALPAGAPCNWNDVLNSQIQSLMCGTILLNIISEIYMHHYSLPDLAKSINHEAKVVQPALSVIILGLVLTGGYWKWISLGVVRVLAKLLMGASMLSYVGHSLVRKDRHQGVKAQKEYYDNVEKEQRKMEEQQRKMSGQGDAIYVAAAGGEDGV